MCCRHRQTGGTWLTRGGHSNSTGQSAPVPGNKMLKYAPLHMWNCKIIHPAASNVLQFLCFSDRYKGIIYSMKMWDPASSENLLKLIPNLLIVLEYLIKVEVTQPSSRLWHRLRSWQPKWIPGHAHLDSHEHMQEAEVENPGKKVKLFSTLFQSPGIANKHNSSARR